jgi:hypothetical protein
MPYETLKFLDLKKKVAIGSIVVLIIAATFIFRHVEGWSYVDSFYFVVATSGTVGYGDIAPVTDLGKMIASVYILLMVPIIIYSFTLVAEGYIDKKVIHKMAKSIDKSQDVLNKK